MKKNRQIILSLLSVFVFCLTTLTGCSNDPKNFSYGALTVTLNKTFKESKNSAFNLYVTSENVIFSVVEESEENLEFSGYTITNLKGYCDEILILNNVSESELKQRNEHPIPMYIVCITVQALIGYANLYVKRRTMTIIKNEY